jgi:hypothetical protein
MEAKMKRLILLTLSILLLAEIGLAQSFGRNGSSAFRGGSVTLALKLSNGLVATPSLTFSSDLNSGLFWTSADLWGATVGGSEVARFYNAGADATTQFIISPGASLGAAATPSLAFGDGNTGFYEASDNTLRLSLGGTDQWEFTSNILQNRNGYGPALINVGSTKVKPVFARRGDNDTGMGFVTAGPTDDALSLIAGGVEGIRITESTSDYVEHKVGTAYTPSGDQSVANDATITIDNTIVRIVGDGGVALLDNDPAIEDGISDGQMIIIQGTGNVVTIADGVNTALDGDANVALGQGDTIQLIWDAGDSVWYEVSRSNN